MATGRFRGRSIQPVTRWGARRWAYTPSVKLGDRVSIQSAQVSPMATSESSHGVAGLMPPREQKRVFEPRVAAHLLFANSQLSSSTTAGGAAASARNLLWRDSRADDRLPCFVCSAGQRVPPCARDESSSRRSKHAPRCSRRSL